MIKSILGCFCCLYFGIAVAASALAADQRILSACVQGKGDENACQKVLSRGAREPANNRAIAHLGMGKVYMFSNKFNESLEEFNKAIRLNPNLSDVYQGRAAVYMMLSHYSLEDKQKSFVFINKAISELDTFLQYQPESIPGLQTRGYIFASIGEYQKAVGDYDAALRVNHDVPILYTLRSFSQRRLRRFDEALADCDFALKLAPRDPTTFWCRAATYGDKREFDLALADYKVALDIAPNNADIYVDRAYLYKQKGDLDSALIDIEKALTLSPSDLLKAHALRAEIFARKKQFDDAIKEGSYIVRQHGDSSFGYNIRAWSLFMKGDYDKASEDIEVGINLDPKYARLYGLKAEIYEKHGEYDKAAGLFDRAIELDPSDADLYFYRGDAFQSKGELIRAIADFRKSLDLDLGPDERTDAKARLDIIEATLKRPHSNEIDTLPKDRISTEAHEKRIAIVFGNSHYSTVGMLPNSARDASSIAAALRLNGFETTSVLDATRTQMISALRDFEKQADNSDWALVYFAGHGIEIGGANYLVPVDAQLESDRDVGDETVPLSRVEAAVQGAHKLRLILLDACRENPFLVRMQRTASVSRAVERGLARVEPNPGTMIVFATRQGEVAQDGDGDYSPFTSAFLKELQIPGRELRRLFDFVRDDVMATTQRRQAPYTYGSLPASEDFYFVAN